MELSDLQYLERLFEAFYEVGALPGGGVKYVQMPVEIDTKTLTEILTETLTKILSETLTKILIKRRSEKCHHMEKRCLRL